MNQFLEKTLSHLAGNGDIDLVGVEELEELASDYPYFPVAQMLLAKKLKSQNDPRFLSQVQKTALYFSNPYWLHYQLLNSIPAAPILHKKGTINNEELSVESTITENETTFPPATPKFSKDHITASGQLAKVVLTDGDDNIDVDQLVNGPSTLLEPVPETSHKEDNSEAETLIKQDDGAVGLSTHEEKNSLADDKTTENEMGENNALTGEVVEDVPITTEFSLEEIKASDELAHETLAEVDIETDAGPKFILSGQETAPEDVPITTEFTLEELQKSDELAHETLAEVYPETNGDAKFVLPGQESPPEDVPITTEFSLEELKKSDVLAHETLAEVDPEAETDPRFILPEPASIVDNDETTVPADLQNENPRIDEEALAVANVDADRSRTADEHQPTLESSAMNEEDDEPLDDLDQVDLPGSFSSNEMLKNIKSILDSPQSAGKSGKNEPLVPIDPYHTVDYFASQGIKLVLEKDPKDKLGRQLKSFTQWLKHMKKLGPEDALEDSGDSDAEATIIRIADFSNTQREIITEAMAKVLEKQGKVEQAVQIYIKLSFLYPDKSAYFADKIKNLKGIR
jgi:hypothetical protein